MAWESAHVVESEVKATGLVVFMKMESKDFEIQPQQGEI
jgi:hypothetical protein